MEKLDLSYTNAKELNHIIDTKLPARPKFERHSVTVDGVEYDVYFRDIMQYIEGIWGDPEFAKILATAPERLHADPDKNIRILSRDEHF